MKIQRTQGLAAATIALLATGTVARAGTMLDNPFSAMFAAAQTDQNKDGTASKAGYLAMMGKVWDTKAKEMAVKGDKMGVEEIKPLFDGLWHGGNKH